MRNENIGAVVVAKTLVTSLLESVPADLERANDRARYCQLMAAKCKLPGDDARKLVLCSWIAALPADSPLVVPLTLEEGVPEILQPQSGAPLSAAAEILDMVKTFLEIRDQAKATAQPLSSLRSRLNREWASTPERQFLARRFLQVLREEALLLRQGDSAAGCILIVDSQEQVAPVLSPPLTQQGFDVTVAQNVAEAWPTVREGAVDLILCEMELPLDSGTDFCAAVKKSSAGGQPIPVILLTGKRSRNVINAGLRAGADDVLPKPVDMERLCLRIRHLLSQRPRPAAAATGTDASGALNGSLATIDFTDLIQILAGSRRDTTITFRHATGTGQVVLSNGGVVHAQTGDKSGEEAFFEMMRWPDAQFTTSGAAFTGAATIQTSIMGLLLDGAQRLDESR